MKYMNVRSSQRFLAFAVDMALINMVVRLIVQFIPIYAKNAAIVSEYYTAMNEGNLINYNVEEFMQILQYMLIGLGIMLLVEIPLFILYFVILPYFWEKQTIGRFLMHIKVVSKTEEKAKFSNLFLREMIGGYLILQVLSVSCVVPLIYWYLSTTTGRTLSDMIGGTRLIDTRFINVEFLHKDEGKPEDKDEYIDAFFTDVPENEENSLKKEDKVDYPFDEPNDSSKDEETEYRVF